MKLTKQQVEQICKKLDEILVSFSFLAKGNHNDNYLIETKKKKFVLKIANNHQFKHLKKEFTILNLLKQDLAPKVYIYDDSKKIISKNYFVEEFIKGNIPNKIDNNFLILMAKWLKKLHSKKQKAHKYILLNAVKPYYKNFKKYNFAIDKELADYLENLFKKALTFLKENNNIFSDCKKFSLIHRDLSKDNILLLNNKIKVLDWEFAGYGLPEYDLVYFIDSYKLNKQQRNLFLKTYRYSNSETAQRKLNAVQKK